MQFLCFIAADDRSAPSSQISAVDASTVSAKDMGDAPSAKRARGRPPKKPTDADSTSRKAPKKSPRKTEIEKLMVPNRVVSWDKEVRWSQ